MVIAIVGTPSDCCDSTLRRVNARGQFLVNFELWNDADTMRVLAVTVASVVTINESSDCC